MRDEVDAANTSTAFVQAKLRWEKKNPPLKENETSLISGLSGIKRLKRHTYSTGENPSPAFARPTPYYRQQWARKS